MRRVPLFACVSAGLLLAGCSLFVDVAEGEGEGEGDVGEGEGEGEGDVGEGEGDVGEGEGDAGEGEGEGDGGEGEGDVGEGEGEGDVGASVCGDSQPGVGEECDDGNNLDSDGCDTNCTLTTCGNGIVTAPEQCDDGNSDSTDGCRNDCVAAACGDGFLREGVEECDDGDLDDDDGCSPICTRIFFPPFEKFPRRIPLRRADLGIAVNVPVPVLVGLPGHADVVFAADDGSGVVTLLAAERDDNDNHWLLLPPPDGVPLYAYVDASLDVGVEAPPASAVWADYSFVAHLNDNTNAVDSSAAGFDGDAPDAFLMVGGRLDPGLSLTCATLTAPAPPSDFAVLAVASLGNADATLLALRDSTSASGAGPTDFGVAARANGNAVFVRQAPSSNNEVTRVGAGPIVAAALFGSVSAVCADGNCFETMNPGPRAGTGFVAGCTADGRGAVALGELRVRTAHIAQSVVEFESYGVRVNTVVVPAAEELP